MSVSLLSASNEPYGGFLVAQQLRVHLEKQETRETWVWSPGQEDPLEEGMATHSGMLVWKIPWTEEAGGLQSLGL